LIAQVQNSLIKNDIKIEQPKSSSELRFDFILEKLNLIFENYEKQETPVFLYIKDGFIEKTAYFLAGFSQRPISIGIAGESASGKSTIAFDMMGCIENFENKHKMKNLITRINTDDYYYDRSKEVLKAGGFDNFVKNYDLDSPDAIELSLLCSHIEKLKKGQSVWLPKYDMSGTAKRYDNHTVAPLGKIIISEGLFTLTDKIKDAFDFKVFVHVDEKIQKQRWFCRAEQRGIKDSADEMYANIIEKSQKNVRPTKSNADIIINGDISRSLYKMFVADVLDVIENSMLIEA
jgi:uridine kinase